MIAPAKTSASSRAKSAAVIFPATGICSIPNCTRPAKLRGVCQSCYQNATKLVQRGSTTWEELERLGVVRPPHAGPHGYRSPLYVALETAREQAEEQKQAGRQAASKRPASTTAKAEKSKATKAKRR